MSGALHELQILALDCQAGGSTPAHGDLLELGWASCAGAGIVGPVRSRWILPRTDRPVPWAIRGLTGWSEACLAEAVDEAQAWAELRADIARTGPNTPPAGKPTVTAGAPTVIHFARFELPFLRDLCRRIDGSDHLPLDVICLHTIAARLFPDLPRRNIRALAGYLGHSPELVRRAGGHVEATAFIWGALLPRLAQLSVHSWSDLKTWLEQSPAPARRARPVFPFVSDGGRALPDRPGVYRFLRRSGDVLYVGKAASLKKRVASHFRSRGPANERVLELLTQVHEVTPTETASLVEAALLETDEIKRLDPPYNVQLRAVGRQAWFASRDLREAAPAPDADHPIGPLPSERALMPLAAMTALAEGVAAAPALCAAALAVPAAFSPPPSLFDQGFRTFVADHLAGVDQPTAAGRLASASRALWLVRGHAEPEPEPGDLAGADAGPSEWDLARVRRRLERTLVQTGLLRRRARFLCLLAEAIVAFRERDMTGARGLVISAGQIRERCALADVMTIASWPSPLARPHHQRQACFDAAGYDRLRVLLTEIHRVQDEGGQAALRVGSHTFAPDRLARLMRAI